MKVCPRCQSRYDDESRFCRKDGVELVPDRAVAPEVIARRELLERRIGREPENVGLLEELGDLLAEIPLYDEALVQYFKALELEAGAAPVRRKVAEVYRARGDWADAARHLEVLVEATPADLGLLGALAEVYVRADRKPEAAQVLARMAELAPADAGLWRRRRDLLHELRRDEELFAVQRRLTDLDPSDLANWFPLARRYVVDAVEAPAEELARLERRLSQAQAARETGPGQRASHVVLYLAALRLRLGTAGPGLRDLLREVDSAGLDAGLNRLAARCLAELGELSERSGDAEQAADCFGAALKFHDNEAARRGLGRLHRMQAEALLSRKRYGEAAAVCRAGLAAAGADPDLEALCRVVAKRRAVRTAAVAGAVLAGLLLGLLVFLYAERRGPFGEAPTEEDLRGSFASFLDDQDGVEGLKKGDGGKELSFTVGEDRWRVTIEAASVAPQNDDTGSFRGTLQTRWERNGAPVSARRGLPPALAKAGLGPRANDARYNRYRKKWRW